MPTSNFDIDANIQGWLKSHLIDGPMGALPGGRKSPYVPNVCSVRTIFDTQTETDEIAVVIDGGPSIETSKSLRITEVREIHDVLRKMAPGEQELWESAFVKFIRTPEIYARSGDLVNARKRGTAGARIEWDRAAPKQGLLTAGHVVGGQTTARVGGSLGTIAFSIDFLNSGTIPTADVAVVELSDTCECSFDTAGSAKRGDWIEFILSGKSKPTQIVSIDEDGLYMGGRLGTAGNVYFAHPSVTKSGDSGALAINGHGEIIGHLIGGSGDQFDFIQAISYQLEAIRLPQVHF